MAVRPRGRIGADDLGEVPDGGLQHERTALAWDRTALAMLVTGALLLRHLGPPFTAWHHLPAYLALGVGGVLLGSAARRYRSRTRDLRHGESAVRPGLVRLTGISVVIVGTAALLGIVLSA